MSPNLRDGDTICIEHERQTTEEVKVVTLHCLCNFPKACVETMVVRLREHSSTSSGSPILPSIRITDYDRRTPSQPHVSSDSESSILGHSFGQFGPELQPEVNTRMWLGVPGASYGSPNLVGMYILHHKSIPFAK